MSTEMMGSALQKQMLLYLSAYAKCGVPLPSFTNSWRRPVERCVRYMKPAQTIAVD